MLRHRCISVSLSRSSRALRCVTKSASAHDAVPIRTRQEFCARACAPASRLPMPNGVACESVGGRDDRSSLPIRCSKPSCGRARTEASTGCLARRDHRTFFVRKVRIGPSHPGARAMLVAAPRRGRGELVAGRAVAGADKTAVKPPCTRRPSLVDVPRQRRNPAAVPAAGRQRRRLRRFDKTAPPAVAG